jgi:long-chain fatty acid transport protein
MVNKTTRTIIVLIIFIARYYSSGYPAGFQIYNQDAAAAAMGNSFTAIADNSSAVFYNPAGINQLEGTQLRSGFHLVFPNTSFRGSKSGERTDMGNDIAALLMGYLTHKVNDKISIGGGIFTPYGLVTEWPGGWEGNSLKRPDSK